LGSDDGDGYCASCGRRLLSRAVPPSGNRFVPAEHDLTVEERSQLAACVHAGLTRDRNEDAAALGTGTTPAGDPFYVLVVCDGIGSSSHAELASAVAASTVRDALARFGRSAGNDGTRAEAAMAQALRDAHEAVCAQGAASAADPPPATTCVAAFVVRSRLVVGWVGDSRAYWLTDRGAQLLTRDHSCANDAVARGEATLEKAMRAPDAHALTRSLGLLESGDRPRLEVDVVARDLAGAGRLLLCTDGLWNYYPLPEQMGELAAGRRRATTAGQLVRFLVHRALVRGGQDNVSVAVHAHVVPAPTP
jgi:serine/threonine protein phosphatase PrpC